jgi:hypothetical protein
MVAAVAGRVIIMLTQSCHVAAADRLKAYMGPVHVFVLTKLLTIRGSPLDLPATVEVGGVHCPAKALAIPNIPNRSAIVLSLLLESLML